jgi:hypothetical protein
VHELCAQLALWQALAGAQSSTVTQQPAPGANVFTQALRTQLSLVQGFASLQSELRTQAAQAPPVGVQTWPVHCTVKQPPAGGWVQSPITLQLVSDARALNGGADASRQPASSNSASTVPARVDDMKPPALSIVPQAA